MLNINYQGDKKFQELLGRLSCPKKLREIKALLNGVIAAQDIVKPSVIIQAIFDREVVYESMDQAKAFMSNLMGLWNLIADSHSNDLYFQDERIDYPETFDGLIERLNDAKAEINSFVKGLELGRTDPNIMEDNGQEAFKRIAEANIFIEEYLELLDEKMEQDEIDSMHETLGKFDEMVLYCKNTVIKYLRQLRRKMIRELDNAPVRSEKIGRNDPCPCGSGKKYKKCCLLKIN